MPIKPVWWAEPKDWITERGNDDTLDDDEKPFIYRSTGFDPALRVFLDVCSFCKVDRVFELRAIEPSSRQCRFCRFILQATNECLHPLAQFNQLRLCWKLLNAGAWILPIRETLTPETEVKPEINVEIGFASQTRTPNGIVGGSPASIALAKNWLKQCCGPDATFEHSTCPKIDPHSFTFPTRLLEISGHSQHLQVRLVDTRTVVKPHQPHALLYTALSHCWGPEGSPRLKTTPDNLQARKSGIPWDSIPRTYQDAMLFTHGLGVKFIWIDSCCIIQDESDLSDWRREATKMSDIYSGSYLTIMATNAANAGSGLFQTVPSYLKAQPTMPVRAPQGYDGDQVVLYARYDQQYSRSAYRYPLMTRAWCFQERCLSPRLVYFMNSEIVWRCHSVEEAELSEFGPPKVHYFDGTPRLHPDSDRLSMTRQWHRLVKEYTRLDLTYKEDKLPAIGGIATRMCNNRQGGYFAGVWQDTALNDLCWYMYERGPIHKGPWPEQTQGPSWSWASVEGEVDFAWVLFSRNGARGKFLAEVLDMSCDYVDPEKPFASDATGGVLKLRSRLLLCPAEEWNRPVPESGYNEPWRIYKDTRGSLVDVSTLYLVQICRGTDGNRTHQHLIVRQLGPSEELYQRVGFAIHDESSWLLGSFKRYEYPSFGPKKIITII